MPAKSEAQRRLMGADLARKREGKPTITGMSERQLQDFATKPKHTPMRHLHGDKMRHVNHG